jgi:hypothetical protein
VRRHFHVRASSDVEIRGSVETASVYAGGDVRIQEGVRGGDEGSVCAEGSLCARYAERASLSCRRLLKLEDSVGSQLRAQQIVITRRVRGGDAAAEHSVVVCEAGTSHDRSPTLLSAGEPLDDALIDAQRALRVARLERAAQRRPGAGADRGKGGKLGRAHASAQREDVARKLARAELRERLITTAFVAVSGTAHAGLVVRIGACAITLEQPDRAVRFWYDRETRTIRTQRNAR